MKQGRESLANKSKRVRCRNEDQNNLDHIDKNRKDFYWCILHISPERHKIVNTTLIGHLLEWITV